VVRDIAGLKASVRCLYGTYTYAINVPTWQYFENKIALMINYFHDSELTPTGLIRSNIQQPSQQEKKCRSSLAGYLEGENIT
jgi:hypothetical protein